ncbi:MAG: indole-3-glycerol phosphate synthase TrpC [Armatimonadota bacterium]
MSVALPRTGTILDKILATKQEEVAQLLSRISPAELEAQCRDLPPTRGFRAALAPKPENEIPFKLIAEVKKASPSKGVIRADFDPVAIARAYHTGGAACISVLTDETYFQGQLGYLQAIREAVPLPLLRKDFIIDTAQIYQARLAGADAILLIVAAIPSAVRLSEMQQTAQSLGLDVLVEIHDADEREIAVASGATLIGVNNRNLRTFEVSLENAEKLIPTFPAGTVAVAESGIFTYADAQRVAAAGAHAVLVGESLMRQENIAAATLQLLGVSENSDERVH